MRRTTSEDPSFGDRKSRFMPQLIQPFQTLRLGAATWRHDREISGDDEQLTVWRMLLPMLGNIRLHSELLQAVGEL
jgi:hypothetical protein